MEKYRIEFRIFGLLTFALVSTTLLGYGLHASGAQGDIFGIQFYVAGPSSAFFIMLLMFHFMELFTRGIPTDDAIDLTHPVESLSVEDIEEMSDDIDRHMRRLEKRRVRLHNAKEALASGASPQAAAEAMGMRPVRRPGAA